MRLITRKLWRAFPELDRFGDEQCARFVQAAASGIVSRALRWAAVAVAVMIGVSLIPVAGMGEAWMVDRGWLKGPLLARALQKPSWMGELVYGALMLAVLFSCGAFLGALTRDYLLRRRVRTVLRTRGRCARCNYFLGGLPVDDQLCVVCPECGFVTEVDASLGELGGAEAGARLFRPSESTVRASNPWLTPARLWKWTKRAALVIVVLLLIGGAGWGWHEMKIRRQAVRAAALKPGAQALIALMEKDQAGRGAVAGDAANAYELLAVLLKKMGHAEAGLYPSGLPSVGGSTPYLEGSWVAQRPSPEEDERAAQDRALNEPFSARMLAEYERLGVFDDVRAMVDAPDSIPNLVHPIDQPLFNAAWGGTYSSLRRLARWESGRMRQAVRDNDPARFEHALDNTLGMARMLQREPILIGRLVGIAIEALAYGELRAALRERPEQPWVDACGRVVRKRQNRTSPSLPFEGEKVSSRDAVCWAFADPARVRMGKYSPALRTLFQTSFMQVPDGRLGNLDENLEAFDTFYDALIADAKLLRHQRSNPAGPPVPQTDLILVRFLMPAMQRALASEDQIEIDRAATPILIALEHHRLSTGRYPDQLGDLSPRWTPGVPLDPWSGKLFGYKRIDPATDKQGRAFLLYTVGSDGVDNGGTPGTNPWDAIQPNPPPGVDFIVNDQAR
ncbi:MAG TPA: hypothetical protein VFF65_05445 [Phycisphaerales bacterium]|nr:hypothetical protein [Phycisphaerales bacterium]